MFCLASNKKELAKELLQKGATADFDFKYGGGKTALMIALKSKDRRFAKSIIKFKQNLNAVDDAGKTALIYAVEAEMSEIVRELLEKGADKSIAGKDGKTALDIATEKNSSYLMMILK